MKKNEDIEIIEECLNNDINEFEKLIEKYKRAVFSHAYQLCTNCHIAEDISQETFIKAFKYLKTYNKDYKFITWLYTICDNLYKDNLRKNIKHSNTISIDNPDIPTDALLSINADPETVQKEIEAKSKKEAITFCINKLPPHYKIILVYRYLEEYSYEEIAKVTNIPLGTIKTRIFRARSLLKEMLTDKLNLKKVSN